LEEIRFGEPVKATRVINTPGGKGINVSRALRSMGVDSVAMGILGGYRGEEVLDLLQKEGIILQVVKMKNETRTNIIILGKEDGRELSIRSAGPRVEEEESDLLTGMILEKAQAPEALVLSGSLPMGVDDGIYFNIIVGAKKRGIPVILDSDDEPMVELEKLAGSALTSDDDIIAFGRELVKKGISVVVGSLGSQGAIMVTADGAWKGMVPVISCEDTVGAGDSTVAGLVMGMTRGEPVEAMLRRGLACGLSAVMNPGPDLCSAETYVQAVASVIVERVA